MSEKNQSQLTNKNSDDAAEKSKSGAPPHVKEMLSKDQKKLKFNVPKVQMPPIMGNYNKPLTLNDKQMFGCYI